VDGTGPAERGRGVLHHDGGEAQAAAGRRGAMSAGRDSVRRHRETVVRRLLARGLSPTTLIMLLPDFRPVVERIIHHR
jgi:hypothetical protein